MPEAHVRVWAPGRPVDLGATLGPLRRGGGDPTFRSDPFGGIWRAVQTPDGPGTERLAVGLDGAVEARTWGPGGPWLLETLPTLLGADDEAGAADWDARVRGSDVHPLLRTAWRTRPGWRVPRTLRVWESLVGAVLEQKVTGGEAKYAWRRLILAHGTPAPGETVPVGLTVPPDPRTWGLIPSWEWHQAKVGPDRSRTLVAAASRAAGLERTVTLPAADAGRALRSLPGIGEWTSAEVRQRAHGDPDAVSVGDAHLAQQVVYALTGAMDGDDARLLELLEPWAGHRYRVIRMIELSGVTRPRRGARYAPLDHRSR
jgi:3-methyladenine DNA glycosylase/8-oxoguanine DNA glycosylase